MELVFYIEFSKGCTAVLGKESDRKEMSVRLFLGPETPNPKPHVGSWMLMSSRVTDAFRSSMFPLSKPEAPRTLQSSTHSPTLKSTPETASSKPQYGGVGNLTSGRAGAQSVGRLMGDV